MTSDLVAVETLDRSIGNAMPATVDPARFEFVLRLADNALILGQRLSEWCGHGPALEEDIALANTALDLVGQARMWLSYAGELEGAGRDEDQLAFLRDAGAFRNLLIVEQPNGDYAMTIARQFFFDVWHWQALAELAHSNDARIAAIAGKAAKEVTYHARRSGEWMVRLGDGTGESRRRMQRAVDELWEFTGEMFVMDDVDQAMLETGTGIDLAALAEPWKTHVAEVLAEATLMMPSGQWTQRGGKHGVHSEHLGRLLAEMQVLQRAYPGARW